MNLVIACTQLVLLGSPCEVFPFEATPPAPFVYGPAVDSNALETAYKFRPYLPLKGPAVAWRPRPPEQSTARATQPKGKKSKKPSKLPAAETPVLAYAPSSGAGFGDIVDRALNKKAALKPGSLYVLADGDEQMSCVGKDKLLMGTLQKMRSRWGKPVIVDSAYRSPNHNRRVRGAKNSMHMYCKALDVRVPGVDKDTLARWLRSQPGMGGVGVYCSSYVHFDSGRRRNWDWRASGCGRRKKGVS